MLIRGDSIMRERAVVLAGSRDDLEYVTALVERSRSYYSAWLRSSELCEAVQLPVAPPSSLHSIDENGQSSK